MALRPNQIALVKILDYSAPNAIAIPCKYFGKQMKKENLFW